MCELLKMNAERVHKRFMTYFNLNKMVWDVSVVIMLAGGSTMVALSSDNTVGDLSPGQILAKAQENYASLVSYSDEGKIIATMNDTTLTTDFTIRLTRTIFYRIEWEQIGESSDTTKKTSVQAVWSSGAGNYLEIGCGPLDEESRDIALEKAAIPSGGAASTIPQVFFNKQWGDREEQLGDPVLGGKQQTDEKVGNINCYVFTRESQGQTNTLWIGRQDFLIHQVRTVTSAGAMQAAMARVSNMDPKTIALLPGFTATETHTNMVVNKQFLRSDFVPSFPSFSNE
jgi:hypothetical protein